MAKGFSKNANQVVKADKNERVSPAKKVIEGGDLRSKKG